MAATSTAVTGLLCNCYCGCDCASLNFPAISRTSLNAAQLLRCHSWCVDWRRLTAPSRFRGGSVAAPCHCAVLCCAVPGHPRGCTAHAQRTGLPVPCVVQGGVWCPAHNPHVVNRRNSWPKAGPQIFASTWRGGLGVEKAGSPCRWLWAYGDGKVVGGDRGGRGTGCGSCAVHSFVYTLCAHCRWLLQLFFGRPLTNTAS